MGHEVVEFDYDLRRVFLNLDPADPDQRRFIDRTRPKTSRELVRQVADLFLTQQGKYSADQVELFDSVIMKMIGQIDEAVRI